jgi:predicted nucleic acid-binding protein
LLRNDATGQAIDKAFQLSQRPEKPILSTIVEGELRALAASWSWGPNKLTQLETAFAEMVRVSAGEPEIVKSYGSLYAQQSAIGKKVGENDMWIAATAMAIDGVVLTCDTDFQNIDSALVKHIYFDPKL